MTTANQTESMKSFRFGLEVETFGKSRQVVAEAVQSVVGGVVTHTHDSYDTWIVTATDGRVWKSMRDGSLPCNGGAEVVSPILVYSDLDTVQAVVRAVRACGAQVDESCGIHVHVGAESLTAQNTINLASLMHYYQDLLFTSLAVLPRREQYCKKLGKTLCERLRRAPASERATIAKDSRGLSRAWYGRVENYPTHYDGSRYQALNLHAVWTKGTVEFRLFNSTLHAGKVKAYIQLCLAMVARCKTWKTSIPLSTPITADRAGMMYLVSKLGFSKGEEFSTVRTHLMAAFTAAPVATAASSGSVSFQLATAAVIAAASSDDNS